MANEAETITGFLRWQEQVSMKTPAAYEQHLEEQALVEGAKAVELRLLQILEEEPTGELRKLVTELLGLLDGEVYE